MSLPDRRGFTLLEVVVALAILAVAVTMLFTASTRSIARLSASRDMDAAGTLAQRKMVELVAAGPPTAEQETSWAPLEATTDLDIPCWWRKRTARVPIRPDLGAVQTPADFLFLLELSVRLADEETAPVYKLSTLYPPTAVSGP